MTAIFSFFGSIFGYVLWAAFLLFKNFGFAIIIFTIVIKIIMFPTSVKQQKSMAKNAIMQAKQQEIKEKYGNNKQKYNEEVQKLYEKEGINPMGGCLTTIVPLFLMLGVFYSVSRPLTNTLHIASSSIASIKTIPGVTLLLPDIFSNNIYSEIAIVNKFNDIAPFAKDIFSEHDFNNLALFSHKSSFNFLGLDLLSTPQHEGFSFLLLIPVISLVAAILSQYFTMKITGNGAAQQGCMKWMFLFMPLFSAYIAYIVPAAVGFYTIISTLLGFIQTLIINKFYNASIMGAKAEAQRVALLEIEEGKIK